MTKRLFFVLAIWILLGACQERQGATAVATVYNSELANVLQQREIFNKKRATIEFDSGASAQTCDEYLRLIASSTVKEGANNQIAKGEFLICDALALIGDKKLALGQPNALFGQALATRLDLRSFPSSLFQMLDEHKYLMRHLEQKTIKVEPTAVTYETNDWQYRLEVVATLDVNNNRKPDWVLWLTDEAKAANYRGYQTLIIFDVSDTGPLRAVPYAATMNAKRR